MTSAESQNGDFMREWKTTVLSGPSFNLPSGEAGRRHELLQGIKGEDVELSEMARIELTFPLF